MTSTTTVPETPGAPAERVADALAALRAVHAANRATLAAADEAVKTAVLACRDLAVTWRVIGLTLGTAESFVIRKYGPRRAGRGTYSTHPTPTVAVPDLPAARERACQRLATARQQRLQARAAAADAERDAVAAAIRAGATASAVAPLVARRRDNLIRRYPQLTVIAQQLLWIDSAAPDAAA
jgi:hypothetical protein